jgi:hypothetical protein
MSCASLRWGMSGCHALRVRRRDLEADAKRRAAQVPAYALQEAAEAIEAAVAHAEGDLQVWLQAALEGLRDRQHLSTVTRRIVPAKKPKTGPA